MPFINSLEFKDWILIIGFGLTITTAWVRLRMRIDRADEVHLEIKDALNNLASIGKERHLSIKSTLGVISTDISDIKISVAVIENEQGNLKSRVNKLEV